MLLLINHTFHLFLKEYTNSDFFQIIMNQNMALMENSFKILLKKEIVYPKNNNNKRIIGLAKVEHTKVSCY